MAGKKYLLYATKEGGLLKFGYPNRFDETVKTGVLDVTPGDVDRGRPDFQPQYVKPVYVALVETVADHDFVLGRGR